MKALESENVIDVENDDDWEKAAVGEGVGVSTSGCSISEYETSSGPKSKALSPHP